MRFAIHASMAKLKAGDVAVRVTEEAIQVLGGYGYIREIQRLVIARELTKRSL